MEVFLVLTLFLIVFGSIIISFIAIFQILSNDFNGSKGLWIVISMIGIIGPILYLTKGKKLIIKRDHTQHLKNDSGNSKKQYYTDLISSLDIKIKLLFGLAIVLIVFGYLVRGLDLYFFWESKPIGFVLLILSVLIILRLDITTRKSRKLKNIWSHIGFWFISFLLFVKLLMLVIIPNSDAYSAAKEYLENNSDIRAEYGEIVGLTILPSGSLETHTDSNGASGFASINLILKGTNKFKEITVYVNKIPSENWAVIGIE